MSHFYLLLSLTGLKPPLGRLSIAFPVSMWNGVGIIFQLYTGNAIKHHIPAPNKHPGWTCCWLERTSFWEGSIRANWGPLERTWVCSSGRLSGRVGLSEPEGWLEPTSLWMGSTRANVGLLERTASETAYFLHLGLLRSLLPNLL